jgi:hypothetical protein
MGGPGVECLVGFRVWVADTLFAEGVAFPFGSGVLDGEEVETGTGAAHPEIINPIIRGKMIVRNVTFILSGINSGMRR